jgi:adenosylhomocysteine nucleosidase
MAGIAGVVAALDSEARTLSLTSRRRDGLFEVGDGTLVVVSGMGRAAAVVAAGALVDAGATALVSWGLAGGLDPALQAGTICLPSMVVSRDGAAFATDLHWREILAAAINRRLAVVTGKLLSSAVAIADLAAKAAAFGETGAVAVDMESAGVAEVAALNKLPFVVVRAIVDTADDAIPRAVMAASSEGRVRLARLMLGIVRSPREIAPLMRLAKRYRAATRALATVARTGALAPLAFSAAHPDRIA